MELPVLAPYPPMEARTEEELPHGAWLYEPKWDGFRCLLFRHGKEVFLQSKSGQPLGRYFPELEKAARELDAPSFVLDGEITVRREGVGDFDALLQRIHPAASRVARLAAETPAVLRVFDLLVDERGRDWREEPLERRRERLESFAARHLTGRGAIVLSPATTRRVRALRWLAGLEGSDGVIAKAFGRPYRSGERDAMAKVKRIRSADCVVGGYRAGRRGGLGSLLLGLYGADGRLHHVGFTSSFTEVERRDAAARVRAVEGGPGFTGRAPGGPSRWTGERETPWTPLRHELVVEVRYDHVTNGRFRHGTTFLRWRPDKAPAQCRLEQIGISEEAATPRSPAPGSRTGSRRRRTAKAARVRR